MANHTAKQHLASPEHLAWMRRQMAANPTLTRYGLARQSCVLLNWTDARGRLKQMACRKELVRLERRGEIVLPRTVWRRPAPRLDDAAFTASPEAAGELAGFGAVALKPVRGGTPESRTWNAMMKAHHPLGDKPLCGAQIRYLIMSETHGALGGLAVSASAWRLSARDAWIGWSDAERGKTLEGIVCNSRFLILPTVRVKNLASHVLGQLTRRIVADWRERYGLSPWLMETFVDASRPGTCYRAANWIEVGATAGRGRQDRTHDAKLAQKRVFLYPLCLETLKRLRPVKAAPDPGPWSEDGGKDWLQREFGGARLGDSRLTQRLPELGRDFFARPMASIPQACNGSKARAAAAYRFFDNPKVDMDALLEPHRQATIERMRREPLALIAQDTSSLNYTTHREMEGIGPIGTKVNGPQGLILHSAMAFRPDGLPLGVLHADCAARDPATFGKKHERARKPIEEKESYKWIKALTPIRKAADRCPDTKMVVVADREADIYEYFLAAQEKKLDLLVRARLNRKLATEVCPGTGAGSDAASVEDTGGVKTKRAVKKGNAKKGVAPPAAEEACDLGEIKELDAEAQRLQAHLESLPEAGRIELSVPRHGRQKARTALMSVRYARVLFAPPEAKAKLPPMTMWIVWTAEIAQPKDTSTTQLSEGSVGDTSKGSVGDVEPLEWFLLTTVPISSLEDAAERVVWYGRRWGIEVFHRILKSGCNIEDRQLGTASRLKNCLAIDMVVAWRIHHLTWLGRETPELPCTVAFDDDQWKAVVLFTTRKPAPPTPPSLNEMIRMIARLGGHLGRKSDGDPGSETLWKGLQRMDDIAWTAKICMEAYDLRQSE